MPSRLAPASVEFTPEFAVNLRTLSKKYRHVRADLEPLLDDLSSGKTPGDQIPGIGYPIYKVPMLNRDIRKGKRSGYRIIYWIKNPTTVILVTIYSKTEQGDVSAAAIRRIVREAEKTASD